MEITFDIKELLENNNQIIIPGIGSFCKKRIEGFFDESKKAFFPPQEKIEFKKSEEQENLNDTITTISKLYQTSFSEAENLLNIFSEKTKETLHTNSEIILNNLGRLRKIGDNIILDNAYQKDYKNSFFGLPKINSITLIPTTVIDEKSKDLYFPVTKEAEKIEENFSLAEQALNAAAIGEQYNVEEPKKSKFWFYLIAIIAIIGLSISALYFAKPEVFEHLNKINNSTETKIVEPVKQIDSLAIADSIYNEANIEENLKAEGFEVEKPKDTSDVLVKQEIIASAATQKESIKYEIIVSAWKTQTKANEEIARLKANGFAAHIVESKNSLLQISVGSFSDKETGNKELKRIKEVLNSNALLIPIKSLN